jgi:hypothetical protein
MAIVDEQTQVALERLIHEFGRHLPHMLDGLNSSVSTEDLAELKHAILPFQLPAPVETWLPIADGQNGNAEWWPIVDATMLPASQIKDAYISGLQFLPPGLLPVAYGSGHYMASVELIEERKAAIFAPTLSSDEWTAIAPSPADLFDTITELLLEGELDEWRFDRTYPIEMHPDATDPNARVASLTAQAARWKAHQARIEIVQAKLDWSQSPFPPNLSIDRELGPTSWGPFPTV